MEIQYPVTRQEEVIDTYHGTDVRDPFRWLENPDSPETTAWVEAENNVTKAYFDKNCSYRSKLKDRMEAIYKYEKISCPFRKGNRVFFFKKDGLQNQSVLYMRDTLEGEAKVLLDPNVLAADGTAALGTYGFSKSGKLLGYGIARSGSDWNTLYVRDVETGKDLSDVVEWVKFSSITWTHDDKGFFYGRYPQPASLTDASKKGSEVDSNEGHMLYYHRIGTPQEQDTLICSAPDHPKHMFGAKVSVDGKYVLISVSESTAPKSLLYYADLSSDLAAGPLTIVKVVTEFEAEFSYITNEETVFWFQTNLNAPRYRIVKIDIAKLPKVEWQEVVPQHAVDVLEFASIAAGTQLVTVYLHDVKQIALLHDLDGKAIGEVPLPGIGSIAELNCRKEDPDIFFKFFSHTHPGIIYRADLVQGTPPSKYLEIVIPGFSPDQFQTEQVFYKSKDGTRIPMFIVSKKGWKPTGDSPTLLYGYGGFSISLSPSFSVFRCLFVEITNGLYVEANLRGGGEYGEDWHEAGILDRKQNVFDDFQSAAEYLIQSKYTNPSKLAIMGGSNGGLLVGACVLQRPDLFKCAVAQVGVFDMLRFHKFTIGHAWTADYGCSDNAKEFDSLIKYSPIHNVRGFKCYELPEKGSNHSDESSTVPYPAVLIMTGSHDDRVVPLHSFKFAAILQTALGHLPYQTNPLLIRIETKAGHGAGKPTEKVLEEASDTYAFILSSLGCHYS
eukprot:CAMPEP_0184647758 /NCGR_PEP_ID=MMETSP0308-20130426/4763_1 /TAXON_ID=38269 /ORGANISM="Gloeochaete witrockiana, Strain SAG 46.84" /LENGTH=723 /DNA_ID=CAMNT_0027079019 /DNA_START=206 /DNA_END=2377 /DNA_ORIENTATION=+